MTSANFVSITVTENLAWAMSVENGLGEDQPTAWMKTSKKRNSSKA